MKRFCTKILIDKLKKGINKNFEFLSHMWKSSSTETTHLY